MAVANRRVIEAHTDLRKWIATDVAKKSDATGAAQEVQLAFAVQLVGSVMSQLGQEQTLRHTSIQEECYDGP
jgi:hypothetical protein